MVKQNTVDQAFLVFIYLFSVFIFFYFQVFVMFLASTGSNDQNVM